MKETFSCINHYKTELIRFLRNYRLFFSFDLHEVTYPPVKLDTILSHAIDDERS